MNLTPREQQVLDLLKSGGGRCSLDDMLAAMIATQAEDDRPLQRQGVIQTIKYMNSKLARDGKLVVLTEGGRGRGNKAVYALKEMKRR